MCSFRTWECCLGLLHTHAEMQTFHSGGRPEWPGLDLEPQMGYVIYSQLTFSVGFSLGLMEPTPNSASPDHSPVGPERRLWNVGLSEPQFSLLGWLWRYRPILSSGLWKAEKLEDLLSGAGVPTLN